MSKIEQIWINEHSRNPEIRIDFENDYHIAIALGGYETKHLIFALESALLHLRRIEKHEPIQNNN